MTKNEMINEIKNVVMNNGGKVDLRYVTFSVLDGELIRDCDNHSKKVKYETVPQIEIYLASIREYVAKNTETVETDTEYVDEPKATKKDIMMALYEKGEVKCDLSTAEELANEGFIYLESYEDGVLYGELRKYTIMREIMNDEQPYLFCAIDKYGSFNHNGLNDAMELFDHGYVSSIEYDGEGNWLAELNWKNILTDFCKRYDNKLNDVA